MSVSSGELQLSVAHAALTTAGVPTKLEGRPMTLHLRVRWVLDRAGTTWVRKDRAGYE
jgi:hypothetical protein